MIVNPSDFGLTEVEAIQMRLKYLRSLRKPIKKSMLFFKIATLNDYNWFVEWYYGIKLKELDDLDKKIRIQLDRLSTARKREKGEVVVDNFVQYDLESIRQVPINQLTEINRAGFFINNPFRNERSPSNSLHWNKSTNRWVDYGSGEYGDNIDLYMVLNNCDFITACKELSKY